MTFTSQMNNRGGRRGPGVKFAKTEVFSQGQNSHVVCTIQSVLEGNNPSIIQDGSRSTVNFAAHLPIPIKICLIMRTAQAAMESFEEWETEYNRPKSNR
ncbi:unnamed protein product [Oikopleura dioica]|uniref:Uncharacterized protein n=1 Tax=Oikopleura dioica TaxID=34765 RepID=E4Z3G1_OIKDI|nr:unnamed protein product [Oikopleura dioica]